MTKVTELWIYPVKGLAGISLQQVEVKATGLQYDRLWMVVDDKGRFVSQRQLPQMATITTELSNGELLLRHSSQPEPLRLPLQSSAEVKQTEVSVWDSQLAAAVVADAGEWLTAALGSRRPLRLVRFDDTQTRPIKDKYLLQQERSHTHFADGFPALICNEQTLSQLNTALVAKGSAPVPMTRFRGNIIVDQCGGAMAELAPLDFSNGEVKLAIRKPCERCPVTRIDQQSGERMDPREPLDTLKDLNPLVEKKGAFFGGNAIVLSEGILRVGEPLTVTPSNWSGNS